MRLPATGIVIVLLCWASAVQAAATVSVARQSAITGPGLTDSAISNALIKSSAIKESTSQQSAATTMATKRVKLHQASKQKTAAPADAIQYSLSRQRHLFKLARRALNRHHFKRFHALRGRLSGYPLTPYLDIWYARSKLKRGDDKLAASTLAQNADIPEAWNLRQAWLKSLAKRGRWSQAESILTRFPSLRSHLRDLTISTLWHTGRKREAMELYGARWQQGKTPSYAMAGLHQAWLHQGHPSRAERWGRIGHLARRGRWKQIFRLAEPLPAMQKQWLRYWRAVQRRPEESLRRWPAGMAGAPAIMALRDGIKRLSRSDPKQAWLLLQQLKLRPLLTDDQQIAISKQQRDVALKAARRHMPDAALWLAGLPDSLQNEDTRGWRVRLYILQQDWKSTLQAIAAMPKTQQQQSRWIYWSARAAEALGEPEAARFLFAKLAKERGYYSFLSAERLGQPFKFSSSGPISSDQTTKIDAELTSIKKMPAIQRAYEWLQLDQRSKAAREWQHALAGANTVTWRAAAVLAAAWRWHDQVIRAAFKAGQANALPDRFPVAFRRAVMHAADATGLKPAAIWSIIRQESAFNQQAVSYVGAKGLMQLMPKTARRVARQLGMGKAAPRLFSPTVNIRLGAAYLAAQKARFGNLALAAAAYNAGPHRVAHWLERTPFDTPEAWVEAIPFNETRRYVQQVMAFVSVYEWRQHKPATSLIARLHEQTQKISMIEIRPDTLR